MRWSVSTLMSHRREVFEDHGGAAAMPSIAHLRDVLLLLPAGEHGTGEGATIMQYGGGVPRGEAEGAALYDHCRSHRGGSAEI